MKTSPPLLSSNVLPLLAVMLGLAAGVWWLLRDEPAAASPSGVDAAQWSELRAELATLRQEVERLRDQGARLEGIARMAPLDAQIQSRAVEATRTEENSKADGKLAEQTGPKALAKEDGGWAAVEMMRRIEDPERRRERAEQLLDSEDFWARHGAILEMLQHDPASAAAALHELLAVASEEPKGEYAAVSAIEALGTVEGYSAQADLQRIYADSALDSVSLAAARSLEALGDSSLMQREVESYRRLMSTDDLQQRLRGIELLGRTRSPSAVPSLLPLLDSPDVQVRLRAVQAVGRTGTERHIAALEAMLDDPVAAVRDQAVEALARLRGERTGK